MSTHWKRSFQIFKIEDGETVVQCGDRLENDHWDTPSGGNAKNFLRPSFTNVLYTLECFKPFEPTLLLVGNDRRP